MSLKVILGIVAAALVALTVAVIVLIVNLDRQADQARYLDCMARQGYAADDPATVAAELDDVIRAAELCDR